MAAALDAPSQTRPSAEMGPTDPGFDEEAWRAVIGPGKQGYYLPRFRRQATTGQRSWWHWPAFFVTLYWLLYRKQWGLAALYFILPNAVAIGIGMATGGEEGTRASLLGLVFVLALYFGPPLLANSLYYARCRTLIERCRAEAGSRQQFLALLQARGGTSRVVLAIVVVLVSLFVVGVIAGVAVPAYRDYLDRSKTAEAYLAGMSVARLAGEHYERSGRMPEQLDELQAAAPSSPFIERMDIDPASGEIELRIALGAPASSGTLRLVPDINAAGEVSWSCRAGPGMRRIAPRACRGAEAE